MIGDPQGEITELSSVQCRNSVRALDSWHSAVHGLLVIVEQDGLLKEHDFHLGEWLLGPFAMPAPSGCGD